MNIVESSPGVNRAPKVAAVVKAPETTYENIQASNVKQAQRDIKRVNPNDKKYNQYNQYEKKGYQGTEEVDLKLFRAHMAAYLARSQSLIDQGSDNAAEHIESLMSGFSFSENSSVVTEMYRLLNYVSNDIRLNGLSNMDRRNSLSGIIRNLKDGFEV